MGWTAEKKLKNELVNSKIRWHKEKAWWHMPILLCSKELQFMVLQKVSIMRMFPVALLIRKPGSNLMTIETKVEKQITIYDRTVHGSKNEWTIVIYSNLNEWW